MTSAVSSGPRCVPADSRLSEPVGAAVIGLGYWAPNLPRVLGLKLAAFVHAIRSGERVEFHTALARSAVRITGQLTGGRALAVA